MIRIIKISNSYFVQKKGFFISTYLDANSNDYWWVGWEYVSKYCIFKSQEDAENGYKKHLQLSEGFEQIKVLKPRWLKWLGVK